jgi:hypothetical protein
MGAGILAVFFALLGAAPAPTPAQAAVAEGMALFQQNRLAEARACFERAVCWTPRPPTPTMLGRLRERIVISQALPRNESALSAAPDAQPSMTGSGSSRRAGRTERGSRSSARR